MNRIAVMDKKNVNLVSRVLKIYSVLPRVPRSALTIEAFKEQVRHCYGDDIEEKSLTKAIQRDLELIPSLLSTGELSVTDGKGRKAKKYQLSQDAFIEQFNSELALVLVMANNYLSEYLPYDIQQNVKGFFEAATQQLTKDTRLDNWQSRFRFVPSGYSQNKNSHYDSKEIKIIYQAILEDDIWLEVQYRKENHSDSQSYVLKPHGIIHYGDKQFLIASKIIKGKSELRTFNMLNFTEVKIIPEKISVNIDPYDVDDLVEEREFEDAFFDREELELFFVFQEELLEELERNPIGENQTIIHLESQHYELRVRSIITKSCMDWFMRNAHLIQIIAPDELREEIVDRASIALEKNDLRDPLARFLSI